MTRKFRFQRLQAPAYLSRYAVYIVAQDADWQPIGTVRARFHGSTAWWSADGMGGRSAGSWYSTRKEAAEALVTIAGASRRRRVA